MANRLRNFNRILEEKEEEKRKEAAVREERRAAQPLEGILRKVAGFSNDENASEGERRDPEKDRSNKKRNVSFVLYDDEREYVNASKRRKTNLEERFQGRERERTRRPDPFDGRTHFSAPSASQCYGPLPGHQTNVLVVSHGSNGSVPQQPQNGMDQQNGQGPQSWEPASVSEDYVVKALCGVDPEMYNGHLHTEDDCPGCKGDSNTTPLSSDNMKAYIERTRAAKHSGLGPFALAKKNAEDYKALILDPKRKYERMLANVEKGGDYRSSSRRSCASHFSDVDDENAVREEERRLHAMQYYHVTRHDMDPVSQFNQKRVSIANMINTIERNCLFEKHPTTKNAFGQPLMRCNKDQFAIWVKMNELFIRYNKERPDQMRPYHDPDRSKKELEHALENGLRTVETTKMAGQLLFEPRKRNPKK